MSHDRPFIELNRQFETLPTGDLEQFATQEFSEGFALGTGDYGWNVLLKTRIVVVLGEPGSGKTREFQNQAESLRGKGQHTYLIRLDDLVTRPLLETLSTEEGKHFQRWLQSNEIGTFFLDSVDESKLLRPSDFAKAINSFEHGVGAPNLSRVQLVISSRITDWDHYEDAQVVLNRFKRGDWKRLADDSGSQEWSPETGTSRDIESEDSLKDFRVVRMLPLDRKRVSTFVESRLPTGADEFLSQLDTNYAWGFARRPLDVDSLLNYWMEKEKLGTLTQLIEFHLEQNLKPAERDTDDQLSMEDARIGARCLAAATQFCRTLNFAIPGGSKSAGTIDPVACLPQEWVIEKTRSLLNRPLFDAPSIGRIRFHHRRFAEYLSAQWLDERMKDGYPTRDLENLLFEQQNEKWIIRSGLRPTTAWLAPGEAPWNERIRQRIIDSDPGLFLSLGDPKALSIDYRKKLLEALITRHAGQKETWVDTPTENLNRLADPALTPYIEKMVLDNSTPAGIRRKLLLLIRHGNLHQCQDALIKIVASQKESFDIKTEAIKAVRDIGDIPTRRRLADIVLNWESIPARTCDHLCEALYPSTISVPELNELFRKNQRVGLGETGIPQYLNYHLKEELKSEQAPDLLQMLLQLVQERPRIVKGAKETLISSRFAWLIRITPIVTLKTASNEYLNARIIALLSEALWLLDKTKGMFFISSDITQDLEQQIMKHPVVRRAFIWRRIEEIEKDNDGQLVRLVQIFRHRGLLTSMKDDIEWLGEDISGAGNLKIQKQALRLAVDVYDNFGCERGVRKNIQRAIASNRELRKLFHQWAPPKPWIKLRWRMLKARFYFRYDFRYDILKTKDKLTATWGAFVFRIWLLRHLKGLRDGSEWRVLLYFVRQVDGTGDSWGVTSWKPLIKKWGRKTAMAAGEGWVNSWRNFSPLLPHERPEPGVIDSRISIGLSGINIALAEKQLSLTELVDEDAQLMTRYAINEMSGFPDWFVDLSKIKSRPLGEILVECIRAEFDIPEEQQQVHGVLGSLKGAVEDLGYLIGDNLMNELQIREPTNKFVLAQALSILTKLKDPPIEDLILVASQRVQSSEKNELRHLMWVAVWLSADAGPALDYIEGYTARIPEASVWMENLCDGLTGRSFNRFPEFSKQDYLQVVHLKRLLPLVFHHVRPEDDIKRQGVFTPAARDGAQQFRGWLLRVLAGNSDPKAGTAMKSFVEDELFSDRRDLILHLIDQRAKTLADIGPWQSKDIPDFMRDHEVDPRSDHDLFRIASKRIKDLKDLVERGEISLRYDMREEDDESILRQWLARQLRDRSRDRYTIPQEVEIDLGKKPDLRFEAPGMPSVPMEVKWTPKKWSGPALKERLENQLVGQYMRDPETKYGLYLLGREGTQEHWDHPDGGRRLTFDELLDYLQGEADSIVQDRDDIDGITVFGIDFREPKK